MFNSQSNLVEARRDVFVTHHFFGSLSTGSNPLPKGEGTHCGDYAQLLNSAEEAIEVRVTRGVEIAACQSGMVGAVAVAAEGRV